jgi:site-specific DNA-cytosine methylase
MSNSQRKRLMGINVLSLFDGMSCGQIALNRAGIKVDNYYASELDKYAINVTQANHPDTIQLDMQVQKIMDKINAYGVTA